jgi:hypothetical protein
VSSTVEMPSPLHDVTQDIGLNLQLREGQHPRVVPACLRQLAEGLTIDNLFQATDTAFNETTSSAGRASPWTNARTTRRHHEPRFPAQVLQADPRGR